MGEERGFVVTETQDPEALSDSGLADYQVVVFLSTTGDVLDPDQEQAMQRFIQSGGGFVGIHAAADTEYEWPWYGELVGTYFQSHPRPQQGRLRVVAPEHPIAQGLPDDFALFDEWYDFRRLPPDTVSTILTIDESSYTGGTMGDPHPIAWAHHSQGGPAFYTATGHTDESFADPVVLTLLGNGILWAAGR